MNFQKSQLLLFFLFILSCNRWDYEDLSEERALVLPQTYLSLVAVDTIYSSQDSLGSFIYAIEESPDSGFIWDTLSHAFTTITTSRQELHWLLAHYLQPSQSQNKL